MEVIFALLHIGEHKSCRIGNHEILLVDTKEISCFVRVIRIQEKREVLRYRFLVKIDPLLNKLLVDRFKIKEMKFIDTVLISDNIYIVHPGSNGAVTELNLVCGVGTGEPGIGSDPYIGLFRLLTILKDLLKKTIMIIKAYTVSGKTKRCDRIKETCGKSSESAVSE